MRTTRPYRSHKFPACTRCRQRRTRCTIEAPGKPCILCRVSNLKCSAERQDANRLYQQISASNDKPDSVASDVRIVGPIVARDTDVLNSLVPGIEKSVSSNVPSPSVVTFAPRQQIYHVENPARRPSPPGCTCSNQSFARLLEQVEPVLEMIIDLYLHKLHVCLPLLDDQTFRALLSKVRPLSTNLSTNLIAYAAFHWNHSSQSVCSTPIDMDLAWLIALIASDRESQRADALSLVSIILIISGRPSKGVVHNTGNIARAAAFAQSIGLNHDCSDWTLTQNEKNARCKIWWAVLIHDRWFNFAHGTPPAISQDHFNVPPPNLSMLLVGNANSIDRVQASECYIQLCKLTEIAGSILPLLHHVHPGRHDNMQEGRRQASINLDSWLTQLPVWLDINEMENRLLVAGLPNLQLSYLATRMLLSRLSWHEDATPSSVSVASSSQPLLLDCLHSAAQVTKFAQSLRHRELFGFWLPYNAQHFTSAVILLLRCAVQARYSETRFKALSSAQQLVALLSCCHESVRWDMVDSIHEHCKRVFEKVESALKGKPIYSCDEEGVGSEANAASSNLTTVIDPNTQPSDDLLVDFQFNESIEGLFPELFNSFAVETYFPYLQSH